MYHSGCDEGLTTPSEGAKLAWNIAAAGLGKASVTTTTSPVEVVLAF